mmetsp:Transcript_8772/g.18204  ORF Transcript_8772/g.18204 Transcript_8772/m.18204 type:complete len:207 (-) Transcript_8772:759-1379(-)
MHTTGVGSHFVVDIKEGTKLVSNGLEITRLEAVFRLAGVSVDGIGNPQDGFSLALHGTNQTGQVLSELFGTHSHNDGQSSGNVLWVHGVDNGEQFFGCALVGDFDTEGIVDAAAKFQMGAVQLSRSLTDPEHVCGTVVPTTSCRIHASQGLFVWQKQAFVRREKVRLCERRGTSIDTNGLHETERFVNLCGKSAVSTAFFGLLDKV